MDNGYIESIKFVFAWYDLWIGVFIDRPKQRIYIFPLPMLGIVIQYHVAREAL